MTKSSALLLILHQYCHFWNFFLSNTNLVESNFVTILQITASHNIVRPGDFYERNFLWHFLHEKCCTVAFQEICSNTDIAIKRHLAARSSQSWENKFLAIQPQGSLPSLHLSAFIGLHCLPDFWQKLYFNVMPYTQYSSKCKQCIYKKNPIFWDVVPCRCCVNRLFRGTHCLHLHSTKIQEHGTSISKWLAYWATSREHLAI